VEAAVRQVVEPGQTIPDTLPAAGEYCSASLLTSTMNRIILKRFENQILQLKVFIVL
jgi:hypothetical protein